VFAFRGEQQSSIWDRSAARCVNMALCPPLFAAVLATEPLFASASCFSLFPRSLCAQFVARITDKAAS